MDKPATLFGLVDCEYLDHAPIQRIERIEHRGAYMHLLGRLQESFGALSTMRG